ncbi:CinA family protein [Aeoliella sp.]|uniref:CinA family protein n=1 Tax=Aeoliella sp. TaxID=2795800 RepID=UPI003CCB8331
MNPQIRSRIEAIHSAEFEFVLATTGGGASAIGDVLSVPGGSRTVLDAQVPYSPQALAQWLGAQPEQACSERTARAMAMAAYMRARQLSTTGFALAGVAATASLASDRPKKGPHRVHVAFQTVSSTCALTLVLNKGERTREQEEQLAAELVLYAAAEAAGLQPSFELELAEDEKVVRRRVEALPAWRTLLTGEQSCVEMNCRGATDSIALFPGAFNPLHAGHVEMAAIAEQLLDCHVLFELSIANVDKPPLDYVEIESRALQFEDKPLVLTRAATFVEKARMYPEVPFVCGADTIMRIGDAKYYGGSISARDSAIAELTDLGASFLVFGRELDDGYYTLETLGLPKSLMTISSSVPESTFRNDVSSTKLRGEG